MTAFEEFLLKLLAAGKRAPAGKGSQVIFGVSYGPKLELRPRHVFDVAPRQVNLGTPASRTTGGPTTGPDPYSPPPTGGTNEPDPTTQPPTSGFSENPRDHRRTDVL